jgi:hypothetical protein
MLQPLLNLNFCFVRVGCFDIVLGSYILYDPDHFLPIARSLSLLLSPTGVAYFTIHETIRIERIMDAFTGYHLSIESISFDSGSLISCSTANSNLACSSRSNTRQSCIWQIRKLDIKPSAPTLTTSTISTIDLSNSNTNTDLSSNITPVPIPINDHSNLFSFTETNTITPATQIENTVV